MSVAGLIFSNIHNSSIPELTNVRTMASVPFGCRYRLIDFPLSNMVNSGITKIGIITHNNYQSLMDHIGTGKDWDLARRSGGIKILPPFISANEGNTKLYTTRLEALLGVTHFISRCNEDFLVLSDCDGVCNIDLSDVIDYHVSKNADMTIVTRKIRYDEDLDRSGVTSVKSDGDGRITEVAAYMKNSKNDEVSTNIIVVSRMFLLSALNDAKAHGFTHFYHDLVAARLERARIFAYHYDKTYIQITSMASYFKSSMELLECDIRNELLGNSKMPIYTKLRNSAPTIYAEGSSVTNSCIADGCVIEGTVENSIIFRGVKVGKGTVIKNSILLQDTFTGNNVTLNCVISDKNSVICDGRMLSGYTTMPFFIPKGTMV